VAPPLYGQRRHSDSFRAWTPPLMSEARKLAARRRSLASKSATCILASEHCHEGRVEQQLAEDQNP
jgi:hypothetical protein